MIIKNAKNKDYTEHNIIELENKHAKLINAISNLSLFGTKKIIELRSSKPKLDPEIQKIIINNISYDSLNNYIILLRMPKINKADMQQKWFKAINKSSIVIQIWPLSPQQLPHWIKQRLREHNITTTELGYQLIAESVEGNLLAAQQEIEKLALLYGQGQLTAEKIKLAVTNNNRYNIFELSDAALSQNTAYCLKILTNLKAINVDPILILWTLWQDLRKLAILINASDFNQECQQLKIWSSKQQLFQRALQKLNQQQIYHLIGYAKCIDAIIKGVGSGDIWQALQRFCVAYTKPQTINQLTKYCI